MSHVLGDKVGRPIPGAAIAIFDPSGSFFRPGGRPPHPWERDGRCGSSYCAPQKRSAGLSAPARRISRARRRRGVGERAVARGPAQPRHPGRRGLARGAPGGGRPGVAAAHTARHTTRGSGCVPPPDPRVPRPAVGAASRSPSRAARGPARGATCARAWRRRPLRRISQRPASRRLTDSYTSKATTHHEGPRAHMDSSFGYDNWRHTFGAVCV